MTPNRSTGGQPPAAGQPRKFAARDTRNSTEARSNMMEAAGAISIMQNHATNATLHAGIVTSAETQKFGTTTVSGHPAVPGRRLWILCHAAAAGPPAGERGNVCGLCTVDHARDRPVLEAFIIRFPCRCDSCSLRPSRWAPSMPAHAMCMLLHPWPSWSRGVSRADTCPGRPVDVLLIDYVGRLGSN